MSHKCGGPSCYRTQGRRRECPYCNKRRKRPETETEPEAEPLHIVQEQPEPEPAPEPVHFVREMGGEYGWPDPDYLQEGRDERGFRAFTDSSGITRWVSKHADERMRQRKFTDRDLDRALTAWGASGECRNEYGEYRPNYWAELPDGRIVQVVVSPDDELDVITVLTDDQMRKVWGDHEAMEDYLAEFCVSWGF